MNWRGQYAYVGHSPPEAAAHGDRWVRSIGKYRVFIYMVERRVNMMKLVTEVRKQWVEMMDITE